MTRETCTKLKAVKNENKICNASHAGEGGGQKSKTFFTFLNFVKKTEQFCLHTESRFNDHCSR
jgi:hypothetical protein